MGRYDIQRKKPPTTLVVHYSVSPENDDVRRWTDQQVADWFSAIGKNRGYKGYSNSDHYDPRTGKETFTQAHLALWPNGDGNTINDDTWRIIPLTLSWFDDITWHSGDWKVNCESVGVETYGRYDNKPLPENAVWAVANWVRDNMDTKNGGKTKLRGHKQFSATACPGDWMNKLGLLEDMINYPLKYKNFNSKPNEDMINNELLQQKDTEIKALNAKIVELEHLIEEKENAIQSLDLNTSELSKAFNEKTVQFNDLIIKNENNELKILELQDQINKLQKPKTNWISRFTSRKFLLGLLTPLVPILNSVLGWNLTLDQIILTITPALAFIGVEGFKDIQEVKNNDRS